MPWVWEGNRCASINTTLQLDQYLLVARLLVKRSQPLVALDEGCVNAPALRRAPQVIECLRLLPNLGTGARKPHPDTHGLGSDCLGDTQDSERAARVFPVHVVARQIEARVR